VCRFDGAYDERRLRTHLAPCRHLAPNLFDLYGIQHSCGGRKQLMILKRDVSLIEIVQARQPLPQFGCLDRPQAVIRQPAPHKAFDRCVMLVGLFVVAFQTVDERQRLNDPIGGLAQPGKKAQLFIGCVVRSGNGEVSQRSFEGSSVRHRQSAARRLGIHGDQNAQKVFDTAVTVAQQPERFIEIVVWRLTDLKCHSFL
jgi:hypothetical protein